MIPDAEQRAPQTGAPSIALVPCADMTKLPPELVTAILEFLDPDVLRRAAGVSRLWYASAWSAGLSLSVRIVCNRSFPGSQPAVLDDVVQHALRNNRRLSLSLKLIAFDNTHWSEFKAIVSSLAASLPVLVYLSVSVSRYAVPRFVTVLRQPAAQLQEFVFLLEQNTEPCRFDIPGDIFGGVTPKLRRLVLDRLPFGQVPIPAFAQVTALHLKFVYQIPDIDYAEHFPRLLHFHLAFHTMLREATPDSIQLGGLRLHKLIIEDLDFCTIVPAVIRSIDVTRIPVFEHVGTNLHPDDPLWKQSDLGSFSLRITRSAVHWSRVSLLVVPAHRRWRRAYHMTTHTGDEPCPIHLLAGLLLVDQCVSYLRIDNEHLVALLEAGWPELVALRELRIDCRKQGIYDPRLWPPPRRSRTRASGRDDEQAPERRRYLRCSALETLTLSACDVTVTVEPSEVALLGGALAQPERDAQGRAALVLSGVELRTPVDDALLQQTFSSIRSREFSEHGSAWDRDGGLWDDD